MVSRLIPIETDDDIGKLQSWNGFLNFEAAFVIMVILEMLWMRVDTVIASIYFKESQIAAQAAWAGVATFGDVFTYGFSISASTKISKFMCERKVKSAIISAILACVSVTGLGV